ncbi:MULTISPECIES: hypothetical protein [Aurantimonas]|uniref:hypothetical protein n=1 Tax=Aurantimonas TaxID=182269 RepID=UPI0035115673
MKDISEDAALIADMMIVVKARFVEAIDTDEQVSTRLECPPAVRSLWPATQSIGSENDPVPNIWRPSALAISRSHEVMHQWLIDFVPDLEHRRLILAWSASMARPKKYGSFARWCKKSGRARSTANHRLLAAFSIVSALIRKNGKSLQAPDWSRVGQLAQNSGIDLGKVRERASEASFESRDGIGSWRAADAVPANDPDNQDFTWAEQQAERRRRMAERKAG